MFSFSFKNRIAFNYIISTGLLISLVFLLLFHTISFIVYKQIDDYIQDEIHESFDEIKLDKNNHQIRVDISEGESENSVNIDPVFSQFFDINGKTIDKSHNLKGFNLKLHPSELDNQYFDAYLDSKLIRQIQTPIVLKEQKLGYLIIAISLEEADSLLQNLRNTLLLIFPLILVVLFFIARFFAGRSIKPVEEIIDMAKKINKDNLSKRLILPENKDELYILSKTINDLLDRIKDAIDREKQFTSDASHELRTPLTVLKGTLEVLIRKPRTHTEYEEKISMSILEVDRLNNLVDQLLLLARFEDQKQHFNIVKIDLNALIQDALKQYADNIKSKNIAIINSFDKNYTIASDHYLVSIILNNIISNAIKYSKENGDIVISIAEQNGIICCSISDNGIGISKEDLDKILNPFYRSNATSHPEIKGSGLGLSIVKRICKLLNIDLKIESELGKETTLTLLFNK